MKKNIVVLVILGALIAVCIGYSRGLAQARLNILPAKVGVINVERVFKSSQRHGKWQVQRDADAAKLQANLEKLRKEADVAEADMRTREVGSADYMRLMEKYMNKVGEGQGKKNYYEQEMILRDQQWMSRFYGEIRSIVEKTARLRGLDVVIVANEVDLGARELARVIERTKILYYTDKIDITEDVIAQLDSAL